MAKGYVDGYVLAVPKKNFGKYRKMAADGAKVWKKHGALDYFECVGDDLHRDTGGEKASSFPKLTNLQKHEDVWFSFIVYKNREHRDKVNKSVMAYFTKKYGNVKTPMPFDMARMAYGGFKTVVEGK